MVQALGTDYSVSHSANFALLAPLSRRECEVTLDFAERVHRRIVATLPGLAQTVGHGPEVMLLFDNPDEYYAYIDHYYPREGVFAMSSGLFVDAGYGHFVFKAENVSEMEPVLVHEHTHALLSHLHLPLWLDEGAAVNMEKYLVPHLADPRRSLYTAAEMAQKHAAFWNEQTIQEFWTGHSFRRPDDGNLLSADAAAQQRQLPALCRAAARGPARRQWCCRGAGTLWPGRGRPGRRSAGRRAVAAAAVRLGRGA